MINPFKFRPPAEDENWEDNWLSNAMAYGSLVLFPNLCKSGWAVKLSIYLWTECPCCLLFRGITIGLIIGLPVGLLIGIYI